MYLPKYRERREAQEVARVSGIWCLQNSKTSKPCSLTLLVLLRRVIRLQVHPSKGRVTPTAGEIRDGVHACEKHLLFALCQTDVEAAGVTWMEQWRACGAASERWRLYARSDGRERRNAADRH